MPPTHVKFGAQLFIILILLFKAEGFTSQKKQGKHIHKKHPLHHWKSNQEILRSGCSLEDWL